VCKLHISYQDGNAYIKYTFMNHYLLSCICVVLCTLLKTNPAGRYSLIVDCILYLSDYKHAADCPSLQLKQIVCQYILCVRQCLMSPRCWLSLFLCCECSVFLYYASLVQYGCSCFKYTHTFVSQSPHRRVVFV